jgi:hypothetical protein
MSTKKQQNTVIPRNVSEHAAYQKKPNSFLVFRLVGVALLLLFALIVIVYPRADINFAVNSFPETVIMEEEITITAEVQNSGRAAGLYPLVLFLDGVEVEKKEINIGPGEKENVSFTIPQFLSPGNYQLGLNEWLGDIKVLRPAEIEVSELTLRPISVEPGQTVVITVTVDNLGEVAGDHTLSLTVDGKTEESRTITVQENSSENVNFNVARSSAGLYTVACSSLSKTFTVMKYEQPDMLGK